MQEVTRSELKLLLLSLIFRYKVVSNSYVSPRSWEVRAAFYLLETQAVGK